MLAVIGGNPERFRPLVDLYRRALVQYRQPPDLPVGVHILGYAGASDDEAVDTQWPAWLTTFEGAARERGWRQPSRAQFDAEVAHGAMLVGSPETVAQRAAAVMRALDVDRVDLHYAPGPVPFEKRLETIELLGREVFPRVRELLATKPDSHAHIDETRDLNGVRIPVR
jgi:alkanesulfonate monooxygenase SsuD/methylene tetrahydromethanopterin reductase-like flavin-dependent oxidoreductase (luciferase family)